MNNKKIMKLSRFLLLTIINFIVFISIDLLITDIYIRIISTVVIMMSINYFIQKNTISEIKDLATSIIKSNDKELGVSDSQRQNEKYIAGTGKLIDYFHTINGNLKDFSNENQKPLTNSIEAILNSTLDGIIVVNNDRDIIMANDSFFNLCGYKAFEISGKDSTTLISPENILSKDLIRFIKYSFDNSQINLDNISTGTIEINHLKTKRVLKATATPLKYSKEKLDGLVINLKDITKELEASEEKNKFISNISHEFRTPLSSIIGYSDIIATDKEISQETMMNFGKIIYEESIELSGIIDNLLNVLIVDRENSNLKIEKINLNSIISILIKENEQKAKLNNIKINYLSKATFDNLLNDNESIATIISNLISNAVKFSYPNCNIIINVSEKDSYFILAVTNHGHGIPENEKNKVFEKFFRVENKIHRLSGAGLGLFISKKLAELHGGTITFDSKEDKVTTFYLTMPLSSNYVKDNFNLL